MAACNYSLKVNRSLLDPKFESYRLSLDALPTYNVELDSAVAEVKLRDDQYTLDHMLAFGMYNYLHCDSWYSDSVYFVDQLGRLLNVTVTLDTVIGKPIEVFRLPSDINSCDNRLCASMYFCSPTWVAVSDGTGRLFIIKTGKRGNSTAEKWEIMFNQDLGDPFTVIYSNCYVKSTEHIVEILLLRVEKDEVDERGSGFHVSLEWLTVTRKTSDDSEKYVITEHRLFHGKSVPHYAAVEPEGSGLMIASAKPFTAIEKDGVPVEENEEHMEENETNDPIYYWQQTSDDVTVTVRLPEGIAKEDIMFELTPGHIRVGLKGQLSLMEGQLHASVDHESSTWILKDGKSIEISLLKKDDSMWPELIPGDKKGQFIMDPTQAAEINEHLMHLTSAELNSDRDGGPCNAQEVEECDLGPEDTSCLTRFEGSTMKATHVVSLASHQYLFTVAVDPAKMPCFCLRHDVDALLWQPQADQKENMWDHVATFNAFGYVQASKQDKKFTTCAPDYSYAAVCECLRRVFIYRQPSSLTTVLYNRKEGRHVGQVAKQQVASLETSDPILGFRATNERLFVLTAKNLFVIKVNLGN
ncbi:nudC domain-containing protein 1 [Protopterus annectens]|uniref:nudC domain-containing protein 1 n=1 Tax=Protopterus annectens TaxID=7888 RepID=UPI001CFBC0D2|nr:nudC domain-containing protein 1 [Protopterus annectens]